MESQKRNSIVFTPKQNEALKIFSSEANRIMLYGGSRSGKTFIIVFLFIYAASHRANSRQVILRHHRTDARQSLWMDTIRKVLDLMGYRNGTHYTKNESDMILKFPNGSEIWVGGLDDKERVEKILGNEYVRMYFNEASQIAYDTMTTAITRLAQKIENMEPMALFDMNPTSPLHWTHRLFIEGLNPDTLEPLANPKRYAYLKMNPSDNQNNLPEGYIEDILSTLPKRKRARFRDGEFVKEEGTIYDDFDPVKHIISKSELPKNMEYHSIGIDFGLNMAAVLIGFSGDRVYIIDCYGMYNVTSRRFQSVLTAKGWADLKAYSYCDPSGGERLQEIHLSEKANNDVEAGIEYIQQLFEEDRLYIVETCRGVLDEITIYKRDSKGRVIKDNDHFMDAKRYGIFSFKKPVKFKKQKEDSMRPVTAGYRKKKF